MSSFFRCAAASNPSLVESHAHNKKTAFEALTTSVGPDSNAGIEILESLDLRRRKGAEQTRVTEGPSIRESHHLVNENSKVSGLSVVGGTTSARVSSTLPAKKDQHRIDLLRRSIVALIEEDLREHERKIVQYHTPVTW